jgi:uncharacterized cupin superfamily protein
MSVSRWQLCALVVIGVVVGSDPDRDKAGVFAQQRGSTIVTRVFTGSDGEAHAEAMEMKVTPRPGPQGRYSEASETLKVAGLQMRRWAPGYVNDWHPVSQREYTIGVSGRSEIEVAGGQKVLVEAGRVVLFEDLTGKGHIVRTIGAEDCVTLHVNLDNQ